MNTGLTPLAQVEDGQLAISGPQVMQEHWNRPEDDKEVFREIATEQEILEFFKKTWPGISSPK